MPLNITQISLLSINFSIPYIFRMSHLYQRFSSFRLLLQPCICLPTCYELCEALCSKHFPTFVLVCLFSVSSRQRMLRKQHHPHYPEWSVDFNLPPWDGSVVFSSSKLPDLYSLSKDPFKVQLKSYDLWKPTLTNQARKTSLGTQNSYKHSVPVFWPKHSFVAYTNSA